MDWIASLISYIFPYQLVYDLLIGRSKPSLLLLTHGETQPTEMQPIEELQSYEHEYEIWHKCIDEAVFVSEVPEFILYHYPNNVDVSESEDCGDYGYSDYIDVLDIRIRSDRIVIRNKRDEREVCEWYPRADLVYGSDDAILEHFSRRPVFIQC